MTGDRQILFISRDRGSVQATLPVIRAFSELQGYAVSVASPPASAPLYQEHGFPCHSLDEEPWRRVPADYLAQLFDRMKPDIVVSGSSPAKGEKPETPEQHAILTARRFGVPSVGILDYWGMYRERFVRDGERADLSLVPDLLCVLDRRSFDDLAALGIPADRMSITHNPWMDRVVRRADAIRTSRREVSGHGLNVLFVSQPFAETSDVRKRSYTQLTLLERLIEALPDLPGSGSHALTIWPHPAELPSRWTAVPAVRRSDVTVSVSHDRDSSVFEQVDLLASGHSTVAYEALYYGVPCVSLRSLSATDEMLLTEQLGLTLHFDQAYLLRQFLTANGLRNFGRELATRSGALRSQGVFFSDGHATERVATEIEAMLKLSGPR